MILTMVFSFFLVNPLAPMLNIVEGETITIVVLQGKAFLAQVDDNGNVMYKYMLIEGEVDTNNDLELQVEKAKESYRALQDREKDQIRFLAYDFVTDKVEDSAVSHLRILADHYNNSYANQIVITFGKRPGNEAYLKEKENLIVTALIHLGIPNEDIEVKYKWDRGPEPTEFIKVNTGLRELPSS